MTFGSKSSQYLAVSLTRILVKLTDISDLHNLGIPRQGVVEADMMPVYLILVDNKLFGLIPHPWAKSRWHDCVKDAVNPESRLLTTPPPLLFIFDFC